MNVRAVAAALLAVAVAVSAIELSTWVLSRAVSAVIPASSVSEVGADVPHTPEVDESTPAAAASPSITW